MAVASYNFVQSKLTVADDLLCRGIAHATWSGSYNGGLRAAASLLDLTLQWWGGEPDCYAGGGAADYNGGDAANDNYGGSEDDGGGVGDGFDRVIGAGEAMTIPEHLSPQRNLLCHTRLSTFLAIPQAC